MADSMTANICRSGEPSESAPVTGMALRTVTCISVRWAWLTYPAALLVLTEVVLLITIMDCAKGAKMGTCKGSPLALLFHGLDGVDEKDHGNRMEEMEAATKRMWGENKG